MSAACRLVLLSVAMLGASGLSQAQTPDAQGAASGGVVEVAPSHDRVNPEREAVERGDAAARAAFGEPQITDPTVFVKSAALGGLTDIALAKLALAKSQVDRVRSFADRVLRERTAMHTELSSIARRQRFDVPTSLDYEDEQIVEQGSNLSGAQFDSWYAQQMRAECEQTVALFESAAKMEDAQFAAFASKSLPALHEQQRLAIALARPPAMIPEALRP